jgi:DNA-binding response OmpR family regulator
METNGKPLRVLVVDDDVDTRETLCVILGFWGYDVRLAATGPEALSIASDYRPAVVFLDLGIPGLNGYEVARALAGLTDRPFIAVVSGYGTEEDRKRSAVAGADIHLLKPANLDQIKKLLENLPANRRQLVQASS